MATTTHNPKNGSFVYIAGLDIGNGYVKGRIESPHDTTSEPTIIDIPSVVSRFTRPNQMPDDDSDAPAVVHNDFCNNVDVTFSSPLVGDQYRRIMGTRSLSVGGGLDQFELSSNQSKADQELSKVLVLGSLAATALTDFVDATGHIPGTAGGEGANILEVHATVALALPISEYITHRDTYSAAFTGTSSRPLVHSVTINNFVTPVTVRIVFDDVAVIAEGASAQYAISAGGTQLADALLADLRSRGMELPGITGQDILDATNTIGIDIGEGTVNFPVFTDGRFNTDASRTLPQGYGTVLENSLDKIDGFTSRKALADYLQKEPSPLKRAFYTKASQEVAVEAGFFIKDVVSEFTRVLTIVGARTEVAYVYGGGSGPIHEELHQALIDAAVTKCGDDTFPVLYLPVSYSRKLNREGLLLAAQKLWDKKESRPSGRKKSAKK